VGETWRWFNQKDHPMYYWDELWLMLANDYPNEDAFLALCLETNEVSTVFPALSPEDWERVL
jgi:hypothetical protein